MRLITRCPACGTMFKVVIDQLKVSQGWVRCGHCTEVFDASLHLQSAKDTQLTELSEPAASNNVAGLDVEVKAPVEPVVQMVTFAEERLLAAQVPGNIATGMVAVSDMVPSQSAQIGLKSPDGEFPEARPDGEVSFVRDSRRRAVWRRPAVRSALCLVCLLLLVLLLGQFSVQYRDTLAAMEPKLKPWLLRLCEPLQCEIAPLRHIEAVVIDSSSFIKIDSNSYRLSFTLKNIGLAPVAMPSLEVSLTDSQDQAVIRRVVMPDQFVVTDIKSQLGAGAELSGVVVMQVLVADALNIVDVTPPATVALRVAGYRVLAFYP